MRKVILIRIVYSLYSQKCSIYRPCLSGPAGSGVAVSLTSPGCPGRTWPRTIPCVIRQHWPLIGHYTSYSPLIGPYPLTLAPKPRPRPRSVNLFTPSLSLAAPGTFEDTDRPGPGRAGGYWKYCLGQVKIMSLAWAGLGWGLF